MALTLFLDFDGVLHSMSGHMKEPFCKLPLLQRALELVDIDIVISSSWRFHYDLSELKNLLGLLGDKVTGRTGDAYIGQHPRFNEIFRYADLHGISNWRALDDAFYEFPHNEPRLIVCNPETGIDSPQLVRLKEWIGSTSSIS